MSWWEGIGRWEIGGRELASGIDKDKQSGEKILWNGKEMIKSVGIKES